MTIGPVLVLGDVNVDVLLPIESYPEPGGDRHSDRIVLAAGGSAANCAIALAKWGSITHLLACVGEDAWAQVALQALESTGVSLSGLQHTQHSSTGMMFIPITPDGQRTLIGHRGANRQLRRQLIPAGLVQTCQALHLSGYAFEDGPQSEAAAAVLLAADDAGLFVSLDTAARPAYSARQRLVEILPLVSVLIVGEPEAISLSERDDIDDAVTALQAAGVERVAVKRGRRGASLHGPSGRFEWPAFKVPTVDTTGAGDAFSAGLLYGLLAGLDDSAAALLANACGALATTVWGAGAGMPELADITGLLAHGAPSDGPAYRTSSKAILNLLQA
jgi:sugar/nucleoside kinase (ribokinase family)